MITNTINHAVCECDQGTALTALMVIGGHTCIGGQIAATIRDVQFFGPFGTCKATKSLCAYAPAAPWIQSLGSVSFNGSPPLVQGAKLVCVKTGIITILDPGQSTTCTEAKLAEIEAEQERLEGELKETLRGLLLHLAGVADPTPLSDAVGGINSLLTGDLPGAGLSVVSMVPYVGDAIAKPGKGLKAIKAARRITDALDANRKLAKAAVAADKAARSKIKKAIEHGKTADEIVDGVDTVKEHRKAEKKRADDET